MIGLIFSLVSTSHAVPLQMTQQGRLLDASGAAVTGIHDLTFRMYDDQSAGSVLWSEVLTVQFNNGYFATVLGSDEINNPLDSTTLEFFPLYMELQVDQASPLSPRTALTSAPYAQMSGVTESLMGGSVEASTIGVHNAGSPVQVIDASGNWVGPAMTVDWNDIDPTTIPTDLANGDDNTQLSESDVETYVTNGALSFAFGSTIQGGGVILTETSTLSWANIDPSTIPSDLADGDDDTLAGLSCNTGELVSWGGGAWVCTSDNTLDAAGLQSLIQSTPVDLNLSSTIGGETIVTTQTDSDSLGSLNCASDGEIARYDLVNGTWYCDSESVDAASVISVVESESNLSLQSGATVGGQTVITTPPNCQSGQILSYDSPTNTWSCIDFSTVVDQDSDGILSWNDCDDQDPNLGSSINDADCDGVPTSEDCDDADPSLLYVDGSSADCPGYSCLDILQNGYSSGDGSYWIQPGSTAVEAECDMATDGGGYTYYGVGSGLTTSSYTDNNTCKTLGMDIVFPRRQSHWNSMLSRFDSSYFATIPGVYKTSDGGNYTGCAMNSSGCGDWRVGDGGSWWLRSSTYTEPNGDYTAYCWLETRSVASSSDITFNDGYCSTSTSKYVCSTNDKP